MYIKSYSSKKRKATQTLNTAVALYIKLKKLIPKRIETRSAAMV